MSDVTRWSRRGLILSALALAACGAKTSQPMPSGLGANGLYPNETPYLRSRITYWARYYEVPSALVHRVIIRESHHRPWARNGPYYGLMQILPQTARTMGYRGPASGLLDADTNLRYGVKYLRGAYLVAEGDPDLTISWYSRGYYYEAKRKGLLKKTGLRS
ncbi:lytic transglycosylase domain-containing protein [Paracoccus fistulariae]|nr:lytic transglycosylase domain-containing protein [Paracoccus fistulariae]MDB6180145.1 lytic transglycosylase domain-containing protein [Paracoccus fistulariae]